MRLLKLLNIFGESNDTSAENGLDGLHPDMMPVMAADASEISFISGTENELYDSHYCNDLGVWHDIYDDMI